MGETLKLRAGSFHIVPAPYARKPTVPLRSSGTIEATLHFDPAPDPSPRLGVARSDRDGTATVAPLVLRGDVYETTGETVEARNPWPVPVRAGSLVRLNWLSGRWVLDGVHCTPDRGPSRTPPLRRHFFERSERMVGLGVCSRSKGWKSKRS